MEIIKEIDGMQVEFYTKIQGDGRGHYPGHLIDVRVIDGIGCGPADNWIDAMALAKKLVVSTRREIVRQRLIEADKVLEEEARLARIAKHQAKQRRRATAQSLKAKLANAQAGA